MKEFTVELANGSLQRFSADRYEWPSTLIPSTNGSVPVIVDVAKFFNENGDVIVTFGGERLVSVVCSEIVKIEHVGTRVTPESTARPSAPPWQPPQA